jgi:ketosteroid isomerase-like protein
VVATTKDESAAAVVQRTNAPWSRACVERDWDALLAMCDPDAVFMPPGAPAVSGKALKPWLDTFPPIKKMSWSATHLEEDGDIAWFHGPVDQTFEIDGEIVQFSGKFTCVMRNDEKRGWLRTMVIWNSNEP